MTEFDYISDVFNSGADYMTYDVICNQSEFLINLKTTELV